MKCIERVPVEQHARLKNTPQSNDLFGYRPQIQDVFKCDGGKTIAIRSSVSLYEQRNSQQRSCNWHIEDVCASSTELTYNIHIYQVNEYTYVVVSSSSTEWRDASSKTAESGSTRVTWKTPRVGRWILRALTYTYLQISIGY